jgi:hypothetical protein
MDRPVGVLGMSNALAIGAVTELLRRRLNSAFTQAATDFSASVQGAMAFVQRPGGAHGAATAGADITLYRTTQHPQWRNCDLATRSSDAKTLLQTPKVGLTLRYLITTFGAQLEVEAEQLLGVVITALYASAPLAREEIADAKAAVPPPPDFLADTDLETQFDLVKFTVLAADDDEVGRVWSMMPLGTIAPAVLVEASVVIVQSEMRPSAPLPVLERTLGAVPSRAPLIIRIDAESGGPAAPIYAGQPVVILGRGLAAVGLRVEIDGVEVPAATVTVVDRERLRLVVPAATIAGARGVRVIHDLIGTPPATVLGAVSQVAPMIVRPQVTATAKAGGNIQVSVTPTVGAGQAVEVLLSSGTTTVALKALRANPNRIDAKLDGVAAGAYVVRVRVDGVESLPTRSTPNGPIDGPTQVV